MLIIGVGVGVGFEAKGPGVSAPTNSVAPVISGNQQVGQTLSTTDGTWSGSPTFTYQWKRDGVSIGSATANTYLLAELDAGADMTCVVTGTNAGGNASATSNTLTTDVYVVFLTHIEDSTDATTYSGGVWSGISFGTAAANRSIVLGFASRSASLTYDFSSGTIGGIACSIVTDGVTQADGKQVNAATNIAVLLIAAVPTGTSGDLSITMNAGGVRAGAGVWAMYGNAAAQASTSGNSTASNPTSTQTIPAGGAAIGCAVNSNGGTWTASGVAKDYDAAMETGNCTHTGGKLNTHAGGSTAMTFTPSAGTDPAGAFASWAP